MCYSAQVEAAFAAYRRLIGAEIDLQQFEELYGLRVTDSATVIPRAIDRWFEQPKGAEQLRLRNLTLEYRAARRRKLEPDLEKQRVRLTDAQAKLLVKETKKASEDSRIATDKIAGLKRRLKLSQERGPATRDDRIFRFHYAPIVLIAEGRPVVRLARYHCRQARQPASVDRKMGGLYNARRDNLTRF